MYYSAKPHFPKEEIPIILDKIKLILENKEMLTMGSNVKKFERDFSNFIGTKYAIATNSCTTALETVLRAIDIKNGEVIVPTQTFIATGSSVINAGGKPIFADIDEDYNISFKSIQEKVNNKTKAIIIVHFGGLISKNILKIKKYCKEHNLILIEDCAHAHGASIKNVNAGNIGDFGCYSFYATKIMTSGEGGMIVSNNEEYYEACASYRNRGLDIHSEKEIYSNLGSNFRMAEITAILGLSQLKYINTFLEHRKKIANIYNANLKELENNDKIKIINSSRNTNHSYWRFTIQIKSPYDREQLYQKLLKKKIKIVWPYDPPLHLQPIFKKLYKNKEGMLPNAEKLMKEHICLPMHLEINENDANQIVSIFIKTLNEMI